MPVRKVMQEPVSVEEDCGLLRAFSLLYQNNLHDLPVVTGDNVLVGFASCVDVGAALLKSWQKPEQSEAP